MLRAACFVPVVCAVALLTACSQQSSSAQSDKLAVQIAAQEKELADLRAKLQSLNVELFIEKLDRDRYQIAEFNVGDPEAYGRLDTNGGTFFVTFKNVTPYADGQQVTLSIGNPQLTTFNGIKVKATWASRRPEFDLNDKDNSKKQDTWEASKQTKEINLPAETLLPGTWNRINFVIAPVKVEQFGWLSIQLVTNQIALRNER